ncbi:mannose-1-phosphate guanylyltransferase/mannose-6-phosphate isomerase [Marinomonas transparens]|uniref:mannose-1-phosphate guanylyltransferase/mannose-6-phosphate isomerase n=1 Tax=Marinomonas transparens TaxID=2795388 RepID=UPI002D7FF32E|nr:mannose-1-phosphate guanylyltransferase/mannose-6-phosphate isomerase [Marinomonas transparens]
MKIVPVILAGGYGERLWPLSRSHSPKPFIDLLNVSHTLFQETVLRFSGLSTCSPIVVCHEDHRFLVAQQLHSLSIQDVSIILEPYGRNTAPAIALAALEAQQKYGEEVLLLVLPADHEIQNVKAFEAAVQQAILLAKENGNLVTFGIRPTRPETGYGYIRCGNDFSVEEFVEKPNLETALGYLASEDYLWNSGMFLFEANRYLDELACYRSDIHQTVCTAYRGRKEDMDFVRIDPDAFLQCSSESIDYAVMEFTKKAKVVPYVGDWSDIGTWDALYDYAEKDDQQNLILGDVIAEDSSHCLIRSESRLVSVLGVSNLVIVETADVVLVMDKDYAQDVKKIVQRVKDSDREEHMFHKLVHRPWGSYETIDLGERYKVKRITVKTGEKLSVQMHHHRAEHWIVVSGTAKVQKGDQVFFLQENESTYIPVGEIHSLENPGEAPLELVEVQSGSYLGEDDIVRFSDCYGR